MRQKVEREWIGISDCATLLGVSRTSINNWRAAGDFPDPVDLGKRVAFVRREVVEWARAKEAARTRDRMARVD